MLFFYNAIDAITFLSYSFLLLLSSSQIHRLHRNPFAPRGDPHRQRHPGDAALAEEDHAHDVQQDRARPPHQGD